MALLLESQVRTAAKAAARSVYVSTESLLRESRDTSRTAFDVFLSHSRLDSELILGVKVVLESAGRTVYVDWVDDPQLDRSKVSASTANSLRARMRQSKALFYVQSGNASVSRWMPWELGYFDGYSGNVAVLPVVKSATEGFKGEEYLGLYPYVDVTGSTVYIHRNAYDYKSFSAWQVSSEKLRPAS